MKKIHSNYNISGEATLAESPVLFSFRPDFPEPGRFTRYRKQGTGIRTSDGTFEFVERNWVRSQAELIKKLSHGRLTKTLSGDFLLTIRIPEWHPRPTAIIADNSLTAMDALQQFIFEEEAA
ncbi:MAG: hypothetical protein J5733_06310 [Bacteroidaceae bacterium]|nr:hypothetical protein [Bacteroidaceae bacterium]